MPKKTICIIRATYEGAKCRVLHKNKLSEPFEVRNGVRQGCILSPVLFLIVFGNVLREARSGVRQGCILSPVLFLIALGDVLQEALKLHQDSKLYGP